MKTDPILNKASLLAKKKDYEGALRVLKEFEDRYYDSFKYYYLYGVICLHSGSFVEALESFNMARKIKINDTSIKLGFAVLYLKRMNTGQALNYYLEVQEADPKNKIAKKALSIIRKNSASEALSDWMTPASLSKLFPAIPSASATPAKIIKISLITAAVLFLAYGTLITVNILPNPFKTNPFNKRSGRPASEFALTSQERNNPVTNDGFFKYILTRDQAINLYENALSSFTSYRDEKAKIDLNRLLESNASALLKNRALLLLENMEVPGFDTFKRSDNPSFTEVKNESVIFRNVHVIWKGMATNVQVTDDSTSFDLLVGYDTRINLEGIVPVSFNVPVSVNTERPLEVLGRIVLVPSYSEFILEGVAIHQSGRLE